jgi:hypothetical protein
MVRDTRKSPMRSFLFHSGSGDAAAAAAITSLVTSVFHQLFTRKQSFSVWLPVASDLITQNKPKQNTKRWNAEDPSRLMHQPRRLASPRS